MPSETVSLLVGLLAAAAAVAAWLFSRRVLRDARGKAAALLADAAQEAEAKQKEVLLAAQERALALADENDRTERELQEQETRLEERRRELDRESSRQGQQRRDLDNRQVACERAEREARDLVAQARADREAARASVERVAGLTAAQAKAELIAEIEAEALEQAAQLARKIQDQARESAERDATALLVRASQRVNVAEVLESTVSFIELPSDEMKGRIIGREGRNIRALEMATGIDLIVDDTPRSILISSFDPLRREVARIAIQRLVEDGRIHPGRIEEVVARVREEIDTVVDEKGAEAAYGLGISDLHPRLARLVGRMRYHLTHGQNLLQHSIETAMIAGHMARELGADVEVVHRAGLLHEVGQVEDATPGHPTFASADLCARFGQAEDVVHAVRSLHVDVEPRTVEALLVATANRMSENRPGARKDNLSVFVERLKRLEAIATGFPAVDKAYAVKAGKEIRVMLDARLARDEDAYRLCRQIARALERDLAYPGQIKVSVIRSTRAVRFAV